jgi:hypothetical protein
MFAELEIRSNIMEEGSLNWLMWKRANTVGPPSLGSVSMD